MGASQGSTLSQECNSRLTELSQWFDQFVAAREDSRSVTWWSVFLQSWASSTLDVYERHLRTSGSGRCSPLDTLPHRSSKITSWSYSRPSSPRRTCGKPSLPAECLKRWELQIPLSPGPFGELFVPRTAVASSRRGDGGRWQPFDLLGVWVHVLCPPPPGCSLPLSSCCAVWCVCLRCWVGSSCPFRGGWIGDMCTCTWMLCLMVGVRLGLFSLGLGSRSMVGPWRKQPNRTRTFWSARQQSWRQLFVYE